MFKFTRAENEVARRDLVAEGFTDLGDAERYLAAGRPQNVEEINIDALCGLRSQIYDCGIILYRAHERLEHQVKLPGISQLSSTVGAGGVFKLIGAETGLAFLAVNQGPGAFTSLRVIIASINGLALGDAQKRLIGVDGLDALAQEAHQKYIKDQNALLVPLLNAYNSEVYYGVYESAGANVKPVAPKGYKKKEIFLE